MSFILQLTENIYSSNQSLPGDKRETARSKLTISLQNRKEENGAVYRCEAKHSAVFGDDMSTSVTLDILCKSLFW